MTQNRPKGSSTVLVLVALFVLAAASGIAEERAPGLGHDRRPPAPARGEIDQAALHPATLSAPDSGDARAFVRLQDIPTAAEAGVVELPFSHVQGELIQDGIGGVSPPTTEGLPSPDQPPPESSSATGRAAGSVVANFEGLNSGWYPPDTVVAAGQHHVVEAINSGFGIYTKTGAQVQGYTTFDSFFGPVKPSPWAGSMFDPRIVFSPWHEKFIMLILGKDATNQNSYVFYAVSQTSDPTGYWWLYRATVDTGDMEGAWLDYASLGVDYWGLYFTGNFYYWAGGYKYSAVFTRNPAVLNGGSSNGWRFWNLQWPNTWAAFSLQVAHPHTEAGGQETFFVNTLSSSGTQACLWTLTGDRTNQPSLTRVAIDTPAYNAIGNNVNQPGHATDIDGGDARIMNAVYSQRRVFTTLTSDPDAQGTRSGFLTLKFNVDTNAREWWDLYWSTNYYYFYPAITLAGTGVSPYIALYGSFASDVGARYAGGVGVIFTNHPTSDLSTVFTVREGQSWYVVEDSSNRNRWGDYSGAAYDWYTGLVWGAVEYATTGNDWRTRIDARSTGYDWTIFIDGFESGHTGAW